MLFCHNLKWKKWLIKYVEFVSKYVHCKFQKYLDKAIKNNRSFQIFLPKLLFYNLLQVIYCSEVLSGKAINKKKYFPLNNIYFEFWMFLTKGKTGFWIIKLPFKRTVRAKLIFSLFFPQNSNSNGRIYHFVKKIYFPKYSNPFFLTEWSI